MLEKSKLKWKNKCIDKIKLSTSHSQLNGLLGHSQVTDETNDRNRKETTIKLIKY